MEATSSPRVEDFYRAAVGEAKASYYVPKFLEFDEPAANRTSWNWPAFFVTFLWLLYRRMYGYALLYFFVWPIAMLIFGVVITLVLGQQIGGLIYLVVAITVPYILLPIYANAIYHGHVRKRIDAVSSAAPSPDAAVQRLIGESSVSGPAMVAIIAVVAIIPVIGILAAIAIPAYQDYTIRAQVSEGLMLASPVKVAVTESFHDSQSWPHDLAAAGLTGTGYSGKYVESIAISDGTVFIRYGGAANRMISGGTLTLRPSLTVDNEVTWNCGYAYGDGGSPVDAAADHATDIKPKYLPSACRE